MLILASISGIQDFLFEVRESGGKQARSLRFRSFRIQLLAEAVALRLLNAASLRPERLLFSAAAKVCIDAGDLSGDALARVRQAATDVQRRLLSDAHGRLRLSVAFEDGRDGFAAAFDRVGRTLMRRKAMPYDDLATADGVTWPDGGLIVSPPWDAEAEARRDAEVGSRLTGATFLTVHRGDPRAADEVALLGLCASFDHDPPHPGDDILSISNLQEPERAPPRLPSALFHTRRLARHVPRDDRGDPIEFLDLATRSHGAPMLGVLKVDVDSLGQAIGATLASHRADGARALRTFSDAMDRFFSETLQAEMRRDPWNLIYTVFAGGDDMLVVGPWNIVLDFAEHARQTFNDRFGQGAEQSPSAVPLTFSAGIAIIKPRYPIHLAAQHAEDLLEAAKGRSAPGAHEPKDQCASLGSVWKWADHERVIGDGKRLAGWVGAGVIQRGWLHTILELALLRRGEAGPEYARVHPATATSRLAYHVARNWPRKRQQPRNNTDRAANEAREWTDAVLADFDIDAPARQRGRVRYLPSIVRYALLATRSGSVEDRP